jgi:predicted anti-sigma-YlaC factor YlaD
VSESAEHLSCQEVVDLVTDYLEDEMNGEKTALFEQHLNFCEGCVLYVDQMRTTVAMAGRIEEEEVPPETRERLLTAFRDWRRS